MMEEKKSVYHVVVQGVYQFRAFDTDLDKEMYLERILRYKGILQLELYAFCIFDNHAHFVIQGSEIEISSLMRRVGVSYAHWYRRQHYHEGAMFKGRPQTELLKDDSALLRTVRFVHQEPVRDGISDTMEGYPWSSYWMYLKGNNDIDRAAIDRILTPWGSFEDYMSLHDAGLYLEEQPARFGYTDQEVEERVRRQLKGKSMLEFQVMPHAYRNYILAHLRFIDRISILQLSRVTGLGRGVIQRVNPEDLRLTLYSNACIIQCESQNESPGLPDYKKWRSPNMKQQVFHAASMLLPRDCDYTAWSTIACDQFTSDPAYWKRVQKQTEGRPSCYHLTLPEVYLNEGEECIAKRIQNINDTMKSYLEEGRFQELPMDIIYVERTLPNGMLRRGLMGVVDLECYDYSKTSTAYIRATEETVLSRIPPRVRIRKNASIELPHLLLLVDDEQRALIEPITEIAETLECCYDFELMEGSGHIRGFRLSEEQKDRVMKVLDVMADPRYFKEKYNTTAPVLLFAVGDGNHSLATAKECYEQLKKEIGIAEALEHPARYALAEVVNLHDDSLEFEPIYRVMFDVDTEAVLEELRTACPGTHEGEPKDGEIVIEYVSEKGSGQLAIPTQPGRLPVSVLQPVLDAYLMKHTGEIDYIHGEDEARELGRKSGNLAFLFAGMKKEELFPGIIAGGVLPRKTFSMGVARDKRFYLEGRKIQ